MRRARISYIGSYHHVMNRGVRGEKIFFDKKSRAYFITILEEKMRQFKQRLLAYCLMDNHYHLVMQNTSGKFSDLMKQLNGQYGMYYRKRRGGIGYVFQSRFKSTLIQEDAYLRMAIIYVLLNPVRRGLLANPWDYTWSSVNDYYSGCSSLLVDNKYVEELFETEENMKVQLQEWIHIELPVRHTRMGDILGDETFLQGAKKKYDRRKSEDTLATHRMRKNEYQFRNMVDVIAMFERDRGIKIMEIDLGSHRGKAMRAELLVLLRDRAGLDYSEIIEHPLFQSLKYSSLGQLYKRAKQKTREKNG